MLRRLLRSLHLIAVPLGLIFAGLATPAQAQIPANHIRIHYHRSNANYTGWTVYAYGDTTENTGNYGGGLVQVTGTDAYGVYFDVGILANAQNVGLIIHNPTAPGGDQKATLMRGPRSPRAMTPMAPTSTFV